MLSRFSFEAPSVVALPDGRWLAMVTSRRLTRAGNGPTEVDEGPGAPQVICRQWSQDAGRTWTAPDQLAPGAWSGLLTIGDEVLCARSQYCAWGNMRTMASRDGFETFYQEMRLTTREWVRGMTNRPQEIPLPPTAPYLGNQWHHEQYGFPSFTKLDNESLMVVFSRPQRGTVQIDGPAGLQVPWGPERIQAVFYRQVPLAGEVAPPLAHRPKRPRGRWVLSERIVIKDLGGLTQLPNGDIIGLVQGAVQHSSDGGKSWEMIEGATIPSGAFGILRSGRWLSAESHQNQPWTGGSHIPMGLVGGYRTFKLSGESWDAHIVVQHSDDQGKTWHASKPVKGGLNKWAVLAGSQFVEASDGTVAVPIYGCIDDNDMGSYSASNGVLLSHDGGETWDNFSFIFRSQPPQTDDHQYEPRYSEMDVIQTPDGHWVAFSRNERVSLGPAGWGANDVALSTDFGRTWKQTGGHLVQVSQQTGIVLPNGGIAFTYRCHSWQQAGVAVSYDEGRTFDYLLTGPYETINALVTGPEEFVVFTATSRRSDSSAGIYRFVADGDG